MLIGYMRISKNESPCYEEMQRNALLEAGVELSHIYEDRILKKQDDRPGLQACMNALRAHSTLVIWKLNRVARDLKHLITLVNELKLRQVALKVLAGEGTLIDMTGENGTVIAGVFTALAEFEQELIVEQTRIGLQSARARGRQGGRPRKMDATLLEEAMVAMANPRAVAAEVAQKLKVTTATLYTYVNGDGSLKPAGKLLLNKNSTIINNCSKLVKNVRIS